MKFFISQILVSMMLATLTFNVYASGPSGSRYNDSQRKAVDPTYEHGKAVYQGRVSGGKINYCIDNGTEKVKLKGKNLKAFKRGKAVDLAAALYDCDNPDSQIFNKLSRSDFSHVIYYLNKRYRLKLSGI